MAIVRTEMAREIAREMAQVHAKADRALKIATDAKISQPKGFVCFF